MDADAAGAPLILIVDDSEDARELYGLFLGGRGFRVVQAGGGREAIERARSLAPALIVMDLMMPDVSGWDAIHRLRSDPATRLIPVIALSATQSFDGIREVIDAGCEFVSKPCPPGALESEIRRLLLLSSN